MDATCRIFGRSRIVNTFVDRAILNPDAPYKLRNHVDERNIISGKITAIKLASAGSPKSLVQVTEPVNPRRPRPGWSIDRTRSKSYYQKGKPIEQRWPDRLKSSVERDRPQPFKCGSDTRCCRRL
ncbi:hypothetical protein [Microcoleus sp. N3A4]|uniref:hypothetical protein n=1 Tax=Microcoleus sp. N3A4 TaxID=3055379 RepID=UPI002FD12923